MKKNKTKAKFTSWEIRIGENKVGVVNDHGMEQACLSVTNDIHAISEEIGCDKILYSDSFGEWVFWSAENGLSFPVKDFEEAKRTITEVWL